MIKEVEACPVRKIGQVNPDDYDGISKILNVIGNKTRLTILSLMVQYGEICTCELEEWLKMPQPTVTAHLRKMYDSGILKRREKWRFSYYSISESYRPLVTKILNELKEGQAKHLK
ncbi:MAG: metalloregulator ArsR/SmtB family transcription factor [Candidatus Thermoplasmatota archaeon]|jgi:ArsR family transcriptional regulator|nr:metalloregulator ArsR/SmtB family transcription factor [Candidatus Thermoplasmatota archaeon]